MSGNHNAYQFKEGSMSKELLGMSAAQLVMLAQDNRITIEAQAKEIDDLYKLKLEIALLQRVANEDQAEINELRAALVECQSAMTQATKPPCACFAGCDNCDLEPNANDLMRAALTRCKELLT